MRIRRTTFVKYGQPVTLAYIEAISDQHPEAIDGAPSPPAPPPAPPRERGPRLTAHYIRKVLRKPEPPRPDEAKYEAVMRRIMREGAP